MTTQPKTRTETTWQDIVHMQQEQINEARAVIQALGGRGYGIPLDEAIAQLFKVELPKKEKKLKQLNLFESE